MKRVGQGDRSMTNKECQYRMRDMIGAFSALLRGSDVGAPWMVSIDEVGTFYLHSTRNGYRYSVAVAPAPTPQPAEQVA